jgi:hypothetical protein
MRTELYKRVQDLIKLYSYNGLLTDGTILDCIYDTMSYDDIDNDDKVWMVNELLSFALNEHCPTCGDSDCDNPLPCQTGDGV